MREELRPALAELLGTFALVLLGAGAATLGAGLMGVAAAHGLALVLVIYTVGYVSGAHVNPAVTLGIAAAGKMAWRRAGVYGVAQVAGALAAAVTLRAAIPGEIVANAGLGETVLAEGVSPARGLLVEAVLTTLLALSVMVSGVLGRSGNLSGLVIGLSLVGLILMGGPLTGASFNPARTLGPGLVTGNLPDLWVYLVGPALGGVAGAFLGRYFGE